MPTQKPPFAWWADGSLTVFLSAQKVLDNYPSHEISIRNTNFVALEKLAWYKLGNGLTLEQLGVEMGRTPEQLAVVEWKALPLPAEPGRD